MAWTDVFVGDEAARRKKRKKRIEKLKKRKTKSSKQKMIDKKDVGETLGKELSKKEKLEVEKAVKKTVAEYREALKLLGTT